MSKFSRTVVDAVKTKYAPTPAPQDEVIYVSGKQAKEVGFDKIARQQAQLQHLKIVVLERMRVRHDDDDDDNDDDVRLADICPNITELDLSDNLFESFAKILSLCAGLAKLQVLSIAGNRFVLPVDGDLDIGAAPSLKQVKSLDVSRTLLSWSDICTLYLHCGRLDHLSAADNEMQRITDPPPKPAPVKLPPKLLPPPDFLPVSLNLEGNDFEFLSDLSGLAAITSLRSLSLKRNRISRLARNPSSANLVCQDSLQEVDLSHNDIDDWDVMDYLLSAFPGLKHLRVTGNPLFRNLLSAEGKPLAAEDGYTLTIARLPQLATLNYSTITAKERLNADTYYLGQIAAEAAKIPPHEQGAFLQKHHPRYPALCDEYGEPAIVHADEAPDVDPNSLAARLVTVDFYNAGSANCWRQEIPKSFSVYAVLGLVGKRCGVSPLGVRLVLETGERDPLAVAQYDGPEWWDSSDEDGDVDVTAGEGELREVELVPGTRPLGTYVEGRQATVRMEFPKARDGG